MPYRNLSLRGSSGADDAIIELVVLSSREARSRMQLHVPVTNPYHPLPSQLTKIKIDREPNSKVSLYSKHVSQLGLAVD